MKLLKMCKEKNENVQGEEENVQGEERTREKEE